MKKRMHLILLVCLMMGMMITSMPSRTYACSCAERLSVEDQLIQSDEVFSGRVTDIKYNRKLNGSVTNSIRFEVSQIWKGGSESQIFVHTGQGGGDCGVHFEEGQEYLVYANPSTMYGDQKLLVTIMCDRTAKLTEANEDLALLGEGRAPTVTLEEDRNNSAAPVVWLVAVGVIVISLFLWLVWRKVKK